MSQSRPTPIAARRPHQWQRVTGAVDDPYAWMADRDDPAVLEHLRAENEHTATWFAGRHDVVETIFGEIKSRTVEDDSTPPVLHNGWWYLSRTEEGLEYPIHCRGRAPSRASDQVLLDENHEAVGHDFFSLGTFEISPSGSRLAWSRDIDGSERHQLLIRDIDPDSADCGSEMTDRLENTAAGAVAWTADESHLFYVTLDQSMRPWQVWRHRLGTAQADDLLVYEEPDERFFVGVGSTRSDRWVVIDVGSRTSSETWLIPSDEPSAPPRCVRSRRPDVEYGVDHWGDCFVVVTNDEAEDFRVCLATESEPGTWKEFIAHEPGRRIVGFDCFDGHAVMQRWIDAQQTVAIVRRDGTIRQIVIADGPHEVELEANPDYATDVVRLQWQSLTSPLAIVAHHIEVSPDDGDPSRGLSTILKQIEVPNADLSSYVAERRWIIADDGVGVPVDIVRRRDVESGPCLIYGYGAYEVSTPPWFSVARLSLLDRGWIWVLVHPRGGGELGRRWYLDGRLLHKRNTFTDVIACARDLRRSGLAEHIVLRGGSAGGLLVGACITIAPEEFDAAVAEVPFVDVVTTMSDPTLPLTVTEWEEWGDPRSEPYASYIAGYSPYDNLDAVPYPALYVTAGLNDPRVGYHEPAKFVARLRELSPATTVLMWCELGAGHGGPSGRYGRWRDEARTLTFVLDSASRRRST